MKPSRVLPVAALLLLAVVLAAVLPTLQSRGLGQGEAIVTVHGRALVTRAGGGTEIVVDRARLGPGDVLQVQAGSADLQLAGAVRYQALAARGGDRASRLRMATVPSLLAGRLLVTATDGARLDVGRTTVTLAGSGALRVAQSLATEVGVYAGGVQVDSAGATGAVPALRSVEIAALGELPRQRPPLAYSAADAWDRRFLGDAIAVDRAVGSIMAGFRAAGGDPDGAAQSVRAALANPPSARALGDLLRARQDDDGKLVGTAMAGLARGGTFASRWHQVFDFHDAGAPWGLVALDRGVTVDRLTGALARGLDVTQFAFSNTGPQQLAGGPLGVGAGGGALAATTVPGSALVGGGAGGAPGGGTGGGGGPPGTGPPVTVPPITVPPVTVPPITVPPVTVPPITVPPVTVPPITVPPVTVPPVTLPPITVPPVTLPPVTLPHVTIPHLLVPPITIAVPALPPVTLLPGPLLG